jgi:transcription antitermination factor NusG
MGEACLVEIKTIEALPALLDSRAVESQSFAWYALKVRTGAEASAVTALECRGFNPYYPTHKERRRYSDRMKVVETAVFPGYIFCQFDVEKKLPVVSSPGVDYIVGTSGKPTPLSELEMSNIRRMIDAGASATEPFVQGQRVRVTHGSLEGVEGILVRDPRGDRLVVSIQLLNRAACLHIDQDHIRVIEPNSGSTSRTNCYQQ